MTYVPADFGLDKTGPQFAWLDSRLTAHGFPPIRLLDPPKDRVQRFQRAQGWSGTGADGLVGPTTLLRLTANPGPVTPGIDLVPWKLTLPVGEAGSPDEVYPIAQFEESPWFLNRPESLTFRAHCGGVTTSGSSYPRSELREMTRSGQRASWSNTTGTHTMSGRLSITHLPLAKPHVVCAQIHDAADDVVMVRLEGTKLFVESRGDDIGILDSDYHLRTFFDLKIVATQGGIKVIYNGSKSVALITAGSGMYFKAGCYTQSNTSKGDRADAYGEVVYTALDVRHAA